MRTGKIARLSYDIREELNQRMENGEDGSTLLKWLNELPEVRKLLKASFEGAPINKQNLSDWRQGGFREWQINEDLVSHTFQLSEGSGYIEDAVDMPLLAGKLVAVLAARYAALLNTWDGEPDPQFEAKLRILRGLARDIALIQKTIHQATLQAQEFEQHLEDDFEKFKEKTKRKLIAPIFAKHKCQSLAKIFGGGESGKEDAEFVTAVQDDLPMPRFNRKNQSGLPSVLSAVVLTKAEALAKEGQARSRQVKPPLDPSDAPPPPESPA